MLWFFIKLFLGSSDSFWNFWYKCYKVFRPSTKQLFHLYEVRNLKIWKVLKILLQNWMVFFSGFIFSNRSLTGSYPLREKCPYPEFFWSLFSHFRAEYEKIRTKKTPNTITFQSVTKSSIFSIYASPAGIYMFKVYNRNTRTRCEICSKLRTKDTRATPVASFWCLYC